MDKVTVRIPIVVGNKGSVQAWGNYLKGVEGSVDIGCLEDGIPEDESARLAHVTVEIDIDKLFEVSELTGEIHDE